MNDPKQLIIDNLKNFLDRKNLDVEFDVTQVANPVHGDFATNISLIASKKLGKKPLDLASDINLFLRESDEINEVFETIEVAGPGFINFFLSQNYLQNLIKKITQDGEEFGMSSKNGKRVIVEFGDPNPFKQIHIGHLRNFFIGESFSRLLEAQGKIVTRANYQGDVGLHVAKAMWGLLKEEEKFLDSGLSNEEKIKILSNSYVLGAKAYEEDENAKKEINELNKKIYELVCHSDPEPIEGEESLNSFENTHSREILRSSQDDQLKTLWEEGKKVSLEDFEKLYTRININYDKYYFESITAKKGKEIVKQNVSNEVFEESDGAIVYRGEKDGLHTRVFLTSQDYATYEGKDLALAIIKNEEGDYDQSIVLTGSEQLEYFQVMLAALSKFEPEIAKKTRHLTFGHVRLKDGKMSSRTGDVILGAWLLDEAVKKVKDAFPEVDAGLAEKIGVGAVKYSMLKFSIPQDIHFDFDESISLEGNSGPYILYSYVRTRSVLAKANSKEQKADSHSDPEPIEGEESLNSFENTHSREILRNAQDDPSTTSGHEDLNKEESELVRFLAQFPYVIEQSANEFAPNLMTNYLFELAQKFNLFYQKHKIIGSENEAYRLKLTESVGQILKNGLNLLSIETVEKM